MNEQERKMRQDAREAIIEALQDYSGHYSDLHNEVCNTGYYAPYTREAEEILNRYGTFKAIREVQDYEKHTFGEITTEVEPTAIINMLYYIIGGEVLSEMVKKSETLRNFYGCVATKELNTKILEELK